MDTRQVNSIHQYIVDFRASAGRLRNDHQSGLLNVDYVSDLLRRAEPIDDFIENYPLSAAAFSSWTHVRNDLLWLAVACKLSPGRLLPK